MDARFPQLLDQKRLNGAYPLRRRFGPPFRGYLVADYDDAVDAVHDACHYSGGAVDLLLPLRSGHVEGLWRDLAVEETSLDGVETRGHESDDVEQLLGREVGDRVGDFLLSVLAFSGTKRDELQQVDVALPAREGPWFAAYLTALGAWPERPKAQFLDWARLDPDLEWQRVVPVPFSTVPVPGPRGSAPQAANFDVRGVAGKRDGDIPGPVTGSPRPRDWPGGDRDPPATAGPRLNWTERRSRVRARQRRRLCLAWALRAAHGLNDGLPLAAPATADLDEVLAVFEREHAGAYFGLPNDDRRRWALTSLSLRSRTSPTLLIGATADGR